MQKLLGIVVTTLGERSSLLQTLQSLDNLPESILITVVSPKADNDEFKFWVRSIITSQQVNFAIDGKQGIYHAFNIGLASSDTDWIFFLNDDDELNTGEIHFVLNSLKSSTANVHFYSFMQGNRSFLPIKIQQQDQFEKYLTRGRMLSSHQSQIWNRDFVLKLQGYRTKIKVLRIPKTINLYISSDLDFYVRAEIKIGDYKMFDNALARVGEAGISEIRKYRRVIENNLILYENGKISIFKGVLNLSYLYLKFIKRSVRSDN